MEAKIVFLSTALAVVLVAASGAHAEDTKVYSGDACQTFFGDQAGDLFRNPQSLHNQSDEYRLVICPIVRDNTENLNGVESAEIRVQSPLTLELVCYLQSRSALGELLEQDRGATTSQNVNVLPLDVDVSTIGGYYSLACELPPQGQIYGYSVTEP